MTRTVQVVFIHRRNPHYESKEEPVAKHEQIRTEYAELTIFEKVLPEIFS